MSLQNFFNFTVIAKPNQILSKRSHAFFVIKLGDEYPKIAVMLQMMAKRWAIPGIPSQHSIAVKLLEASSGAAIILRKLGNLIN